MHTEIDSEQLARILARQMCDEAAGGKPVPFVLRRFGEEFALGLASDIVASRVPYLLVDRDTAILCFTCGRISHNPNDVEQKYCGACHRFHDQPV
jgi:hypothetical protein